MVASCGGKTTPTPTPTPTSTPTPSPTPTPTTAPTLIDFAQDFTSISNLVYIYGNFTPTTGGAEVFADASRLSGGAGAVNYVFSPESIGYAFTDLNPAASFAGVDRTTTSATLRTYVKGDEALFLELPFQHVLRASYERKDSIISGTTPGILRSRRVSLFANRITTTNAISSVLTYTGLAHAVGGIRGTTPADIVVSQSTTFTVTPTATDPTLAGTIKLFEDVNSVLTQKAALAFTGTVAANGSFSGTITDTTYNFTGNFAGELAGPNREEVIIVFSASHTDGRRYVGSYIGG
ncbi:hypothetical protein [Alteraurantiacibacter aestuarii]|nr:hypothetical protein [Alteraurantiacibacter aestuarii]